MQKNILIKKCMQHKYAIDTQVYRNNNQNIYIITT